MLVDILSVRTTLGVSLKEMALLCASALSFVLHLSALCVDLIQGLTGMNVFLEERPVLWDKILLLCLKRLVVSCTLYVSSAISHVIDVAPSLNISVSIEVGCKPTTSFSCSLEKKKTQGQTLVTDVGHILMCENEHTHAK